jgi:hypothetical protein
LPDLVDGILREDPAHEDDDEEHREREHQVDRDAVCPLEPRRVERGGHPEDEQHRAEGDGGRPPGDAVVVEHIRDDDLEQRDGRR